MSSLKKLFLFSLIGALSFGFFGCKNDPEPEPIVATTVTDFPADPATSFDPNTGQPIGLTNKFAFFSFKTGAMVDHADSATNKWDLAFRSTTIIVNSATSGPGTAQVQIINGIFDDLAEAPEDGFKSDNDPAPVAGAPNANLAIPTGSGNGWYTYDGNAMVNKPTAGKVILVKTSEGRYAKMEILSYYQGAPPSPTYTNTPRYYTFRYVYQPNDSKNFQ